MEAEIFPAKLDGEEMNMRRKEWELTGYDVKEDDVRKNPIFSKSLIVSNEDVFPTTMIYMWDGEIWERMGSSR